MLGEPVHRTILAIDVEGFTRRPRRDVDRLRMRGELYRLLEQALARAGLRREDFRSEDRGDGVLVLLNAEVPKTRVLPWLVLRMAAELNRYNRPLRRPPAPRAAVVQGESPATPTACGKDLNLAFRLLDSDLLRGYLANARTSLVLLASASIYNDIIEQGYREIDAEAFQPVQVAAKSTHALAWVYVPGRHNGVTTGQQHPGLATAATAPPAIPHELPADIPDFTGHEAKLERLLAALTPTGGASPTVVAVHGVGGVGKSALAITRPNSSPSGYRRAAVPEPPGASGAASIGPWMRARAPRARFEGGLPSRSRRPRRASGRGSPDGASCWCWTTRSRPARSGTCCPPARPARC